MRIFRGAMMDALKAIIDIGPEATNKQIIAVTGIRNNSITSAIENLLSHGYIVKIGSRATRRLIVTDEGMNALHPPAPNLIPCLQCRREFASSWGGNRICNHCKETESWQSSGVTEYSVMRGRAT